MDTLLHSCSFDELAEMSNLAQTHPDYQNMYIKEMIFRLNSASNHMRRVLNGTLIEGPSPTLNHKNADCLYDVLDRFTPEDDRPCRSCKKMFVVMQRIIGGLYLGHSIDCNIFKNQIPVCEVHY